MANMQVTENYGLNLNFDCFCSPTYSTQKTCTSNFILQPNWLISAMRIYICKSLTNCISWISQIGENGSRKFSMINLHESYIARLESNLTSPESAVRGTAKCSREPGFNFDSVKSFNMTYSFLLNRDAAVCALTHQSSLFLDMTSFSKKKRTKKRKCLKVMHF